MDTADQTITIDASWGTAPSGAPGPAHLLAAAFAACLLKNLARAAQLLQFRYRDAEVEVTARRQDSPPKFVEIVYVLRIATDESQRRVDLVHLNLRKHGTVYNNPRSDLRRARRRRSRHGTAHRSVRSRGSSLIQ